MGRWRNWYTLKIEVLVPAMACRFKSCPAHHPTREATDGKPNFWALSSVGPAQFGAIAQLVEHLVYIEQVVGSSPTGFTKCAG